MSDQEDTGQLAVRRAGMEHKGDFKPAANILTQLARGWLAGTAGLPGDLEGLARTVNKYTSFNPAVRSQDTTPVLPTSEFYKEWLPGEDKGVGGKEMNNLGSLFGGAGSTTLARGAVKAGKGALTLVDAAARNAAVPRTLSPQAGVIKAPGGNWLSGSVEDALKGLRRTSGARGLPSEQVLAEMNSVYTPDAMARLSPESLAAVERAMGEIKPDAAINNWIDKQLTRYVKNDMATERDPIRALAERGTLHIPHEEVGMNRYKAPDVRSALGFPREGSGKSEAAKAWEDASDTMLKQKPASYYQQGIGNVDEWLTKVPPQTPIHEANLTAGANLGFDHLIDELRNATNPASGLPRELLIDPQSLDRLSVPQAVERVAKINDWRAAQKIEASQALANNAATHVFKEYPHSDATPNPKGLKWVELKSPPTPEKLDDAAYMLEQDYLQGGVSPDRARTEAGKRQTRKILEDALKYEGDTMGHCVGGYCDDVASGKSRIYSLRDAKGQPHVTVELGKKTSSSSDDVRRWRAQAEDELKTSALDPQTSAYASAVNTRISELQNNQPEQILQIKGKGNKAPNAEYLPFVQDFVKSGKWSDVGDLQNTGLVNFKGGVTNYRAKPGDAPTTYKMPSGHLTLREAADYLIQQGAPEKWAKQHLGVSLIDGYASGGSVPSNPYTIDAAAFHTAVDPLLSDASSWQAHDDSPQKLALQLGNGATWNVGGGEGTYGSGVYKYDPITEADDKRYQEALAAYNATGLATFNPDNIAVGSGLMSDRANMLESWLGSGTLGALRAGAQGFDVGDAGHVDGHAPTYEDWTTALSKVAPSYDPTQALYRVRGDMSQMMGKPDSRMFMDAGYQEKDGQMVPIGKPSRTYQRSAGAENISMLSALLAPYAVGTALTNAAAGGGSAMAQAAAEANAANAAQGFGQLGTAGAAPAAGLGEQAIAAYQAAQPYLKAANTVGALAKGNPMGALGGYLPGMDLGLGDFGNSVANSAVKAGLSGGNPLLGAVSGAVGDAIPDTLRPYLTMAQSLVAATEGKLSLTQALNMLARYNSSSSKGT